jgi:hypothetical protein
MNGHQNAFKIPSFEEVKLLAAKAGLPNEEAETFFKFYSASGWKVGGNQMRNAAHAMANWARNWERKSKKVS